MVGGFWEIFGFNIQIEDFRISYLFSDMPTLPSRAYFTKITSLGSLVLNCFSKSLSTVQTVFSLFSQIIPSPTTSKINRTG